MIDIKQNTDKLLGFIAQKFETNEIDNDSLVQLIELSASYLNLKTIPDYCKANNISYNGAKNHRNIKELIGVKFVIDNF